MPDTKLSDLDELVYPPQDTDLVYIVRASGSYFSTFGALKTAIAEFAQYPEAANFAALPAAGTVSGETYVVIAPQGVYFVNRRPAGLYRSNGTSWDYLADATEAYFQDTLAWANITSKPSSFVADGEVTGIKLASNARRRVIGLRVQAAAAITTGQKMVEIAVPFAGTIVGWRLVADVATTATLDVWKANAALPTNANSITASAKPALSTATYAASTTLTGWTTAVAAGDIFELEVEANSAATMISLTLELEVS